MNRSSFGYLMGQRSAAVTSLNLFYTRFYFHVSPVKFLRRLAAIINFSTQSCVYSYDLFGFNQVRFWKWLASIVDFFT